MVRWINLGLAVVLALLLVMELFRPDRAELPIESVGAAPPTMVQQTPARRSRRMQARMAIEEARRQQQERLRAPAPGGPILLDESGHSIVD